MKTALIIEDNEDNMELITLILESNGYRTLKAATGQQGFDMAQAVRPDFIILDIQLPDMNGLTVLRMIRDSKADSAVPVIAMTSFAMAGDCEQLLAAGCTGYIEKPINPGKVVGQIQRILGDES